MENNFDQIPLAFERRDEGEVLTRARSFLAEMDQRRSVRHFSPDPVPLGVIEELVRE